MTLVLLLLCWAGATLLLSELRWFRSGHLVERLAPYLPAGHPLRSEPIASAGASDHRRLARISALAAPPARALGDKVAAIGGIAEDPAARLERIHASDDVSAFRARQLGWAVAAVGAAVAFCLWWRPPPAVALLALVLAPVGAFGALEHRLSAASAAWQRQLTAELPVVAEQIAMLLRSGWSLGGALERVASRGSGRCSRDLTRVCGRIRQGVGTHAALREWSTTSDVEGVKRLVGVLRLDREATDVGRLISEEARLLRAESHRRLVEAAERKAQQVWVPVTVAALVPGVIFLAVPFTAALNAFGGGG